MELSGRAGASGVEQTNGEIELLFSVPFPPGGSPVRCSGC